MAFPIVFRALRRSPWYAATLIGTIALSMSLAASVFAIVDGVLFKPLPYRAPERLFHLAGPDGAAGGTAQLSPLDVRDLGEADARISVTAYGGTAGLTHPDRPDLTIWSAAVDERFFEVLGQAPLAGGFTAGHYQQPPAEAPHGRPSSSHAFWRQWLSADPRSSPPGDDWRRRRAPRIVVDQPAVHRISL